MSKILIAALSALSGASVVSFISFVELQPATPGVVQSGHLNISGTAIAGNLRVGTTGAGAKVKVIDSAAVGGLSSQSNGAYAMFGWNKATTGTAFGGQFYTDSTSGRAAYGDALSATGSTRGGYFQSRSTSGIGVHGIASATSGVTTGVLGESRSPTGFGMVAKNTSTTGAGIGLSATSVSSSGIAIDALSSGNGFTRGVRGRVTGNGAGVEGQGPTNMGYGVYGIGFRAVYGLGYETGVWGDGPTGVYGKSEVSSGQGVWGYANSTSAIGVYGEVFNQASSTAGYFNGKLTATGTKSFQIDDPLDPANKVLNHYCSEGPVPLNVYSGTAKLDSRGEAMVKLPEYFESINKNARFILTAIGTAAPELHVAGRVHLNRFTIQGGKPGMEVDWQVSAERNDRWVQAYGAPVEVLKSDEQKGKYLRPELYGLGPEKAAFAIRQSPSVPSDGGGQ